ncbi:MAG: tripartite tricarboxylate transporter TctB family protein [Desulfobacterales bacterium]|nr:tripartite tricarboxylate transporter TctB family protein [Desulfobacterales bacterium]
MKGQLNRKIKLNRTAAFICLIFGLVYFILIYFQASPREVPGARGFGRLTGRFFPQLGGGIFLLSAAFLLVKSFLNEKFINKTDDADMLKSMLDRNEAVIGVSKPEFITSSLITVLGLIYVSLMPFLGYLPATVIAVFALSLVMGNRSWFYLFILSVIVPSIIYYVFISLLYVPLPRGFLSLFFQ